MTSAPGEPEGQPDTEEISTDVIVVGSGAGGSGAALAAVSAGATVVMLEKQPHAGGSAVFSAGSFWTFEHAATYAKLAPLGDRAMQHKMHSQHHAAAEFIRSIGVEIADKPRQAGNKHGISYKVDIIGLLATARRAVAEAGGQVLLGTAATGLIWDGDRVAGVLARDRAGSTRRIGARAVVLATGGFQGDRELLTRYLGPNAGRLLIRSNPGSVGDGLRIAQDAGAAATRDMSSFYGHLIPVPVTAFGPDDFRPLAQYYSEMALLVGADGRRLADETLGDSVLSQAVLQAPHARGVLIFDEHVRQRHVVSEPFPGVGLVDRLERAIAAGARHACSSTLHGLVSQVGKWGIDAGTLTRTIGAYSAAVRAKATQAAGITVSPEAREPQTPPFYALAVQPAITFTFGGIRASRNGEVLDRNGQPVPGLFAGGADVGGISHTGYAGGLAPCFITGMWAGASAAAQSRG